MYTRAVKAGARKVFFQFRLFLLTLFSGMFFLVPFSALALTVQGIPNWLSDDVTRSLEAIWQEIPSADDAIRIETLSVVAERLFSGYRVEISLDSASSPVVFLEPIESIPWRVLLKSPELREPVLSWFLKDISEIEPEISPLLETLPAEALSWSDLALRSQIESILEKRLPGWSFSLQAEIHDSEGILNLTFRPNSPFVLAVTPSIVSSTLPVMFQSDLAAKLVPGLSPLIGLPVSWVALHRKDVEFWAQSFLEDRNAVSNTRSHVQVQFMPEQVSEIEATVNSDRLIFQIWLSAYAGIEGRYPEAGFLAGWNLKHHLGIPIELYTEGLLEMNNFKTTLRAGGRLLLFKDLKVGSEVEWPGETFWFKLWWDSGKLRRPYVWWRYSSDQMQNAALGYRINESISIELYYDKRLQDEIGLRGILYF